MPSLASGNISCTACAKTCAAECRMTLRPSSVSAATGVTSTSVSGVHDRSRSRPSASRTTTIASGAPRLGSPASRTAAPAVVPAATRIGAAGACVAGALIGDSPNFRDGAGMSKHLRTRPCYRCGCSCPQANRALQPLLSKADELSRPADRAKQPQRRDNHGRSEARAQRLDPRALPLEPVHRRVVALSGVREQPSGPSELGGENAESDEHDRPAGPWIRNREDAGREHGQTDDGDSDAVAEL